MVNPSGMTNSHISFWRKPTFVIIISGAVIALATVVFATFYYQRKAEDCRPGQSDGQCGLSTFLGLLYGAVAASIILIGGGILIAVRIYIARRAGRKLLSVTSDETISGIQ